MTNRQHLLCMLENDEYTDGEIVDIIAKMLFSAKVTYLYLEDTYRLNRWMQLECDSETWNFTDLEASEDD